MFLHRYRFLSGSLIVTLICGTLLAAPDDFALPRSTPEKQGITSEAIHDFVNGVEASVDSMHSFMLIRHGYVVAEGWWKPYAPELPHKLYSLSKSFASTAVGLAVAEGHFSLDDPVISFFPEDAPDNPSYNLKSMRVRDLLSMSTGHHSEDLRGFSFQSDEVLTRAFLALPVAHKPGTHFLYNTPATYMCSAIVQKTTGKRVVDYLKNRLFDPLGIASPTWGESAQGISLGGYGLKVRTEDIARFGQLYLQKGRWHDRQLLPESFVALATSRQTSNGSNPDSDWEQGYGFQFWRCRNGAYRGDGAFGQYCVVMPDQNAVVAITSGLGNMQAVMNLIWDKLLPAMSEAPLASNSADYGKLKARLGRLVLPVIQGDPESPISASILNRRFEFPKNDSNLESLSLTRRHRDFIMTLMVNGAKFTIPIAHGEWRQSRSPLAGALGLRATDPGDDRVAASGAWVAADAFKARFWFHETPYAVNWSLQKVGEDKVTLSGEFNVNFGPRKLPVLTGTAQ